MSRHYEFSTGGQKDLKGKLRTDLIPPEAEIALAEVLTFGASKYQDRNWEKGIPFMSLYGATKRHLLAWVQGDTFDKESGMNHLKHALCDLAFLVTFSERGREDLDDRPVKEEKPHLGPPHSYEEFLKGLRIPGSAYDSSDGDYSHDSNTT